MLVSLPSWSADGDTFTANTAEDVQMTFKVISESEKTCQVGDGSSCAISSGTSGTITIPSSANGYSVTSIGNSAFSDCMGLTSITIPSSVTSIGGWAFFTCSGLTSITIPESVTSIDGWAFQLCSRLTSITIPSSVTSIGNGAFDGCSSLPVINNIRYADTYLVEATDKTLATYSIKEGTRFIGSPAFSECSFLASITIPESVSSIGNYAFNNCSGLTSITIPEGVTTFGENAFSGCSGLTSINIPSTVTSIGIHAFANCTGLESINIPSSVTSIGVNAFEGCSSLPVIDNIRYADTYLVKVTDTGLDTYSIKEGTRFIGSGAFDCCTNLTSITIPSTVTSIGGFAFANCTGLTSIIIPSSVTSIGESAFGGFSNLTSITVANGNSTYDSRDDCNAIIETSTNTLIRGCKNTTIPSSVTTIGNDAFSFCSSLTSITIPEGVTSIGGAFHACSSLTSITIPSTVTSIGGAFSSCPNMVSMAVDSNNTYYDSRDNCNAIIETGTNTLISGCKNTIIPSTVTSIGEGAFGGCSGLTSITIPEGVSTIGGSAFQYCSNLTSVTLPSTLREIDMNAFNGTGLTTIDIPEGVTSIGMGAFGFCSNLMSVIIPSSVTSIVAGAFGCENLQSVVSRMMNPVDEYSDYYKLDIFFNISSNCVLTVPYGTSDAYIAAGWTTTIFGGGIVEAPPTKIDLVDGQTYSNSTDLEMEELSYCRTYKYSAWLPWYVPFDVELTSDVLSRFSFAKFCGTYTEDDENGDMVFCITVSKLKEGDVVKANTPYVIKAKTASNDAQVITLTNTTLKAAEEKGFDMYSAEKKVSIQGIYSDKTATANDCDWYFINSTGYVHASAGQTLGAYRFYLTITDRTDNPYASASNPNGIKMKVLNEDGTTVLEEIQASRAASVQQPEVYDLSGRRVANGNQERGIYIINGKKVLVK